MRLQRIELVAEFLHGGGGESAHLDVAHFRGGHVGGFHAVNGDLVAGDAEFQQLVLPAAVDRYVHLAAFLSTQAFHHIAVLETYAGHELFIDLHDAIARTDAEAFTGATGDRIHHIDGIADDVELDADAFEIAFERFVHLLELLLGDVDGMRIELLEHLHDRGINELLLVHIVHVHALHVVEQGFDLAHGHGMIFLRRRNGGGEHG